MTEVSFRSDMTVQLAQHTSDPDIMVGASARVSTLGSKSLSDLATDKQAQHGLLDYLMRNRHMSPFEHNQFTFFVQCPIFVAREFMRHRTFSFNEESGRYKELEGIFYIPDVHRPTVQTGKAGEYNFHLGSQYQHICVQSDLKGASIYAYGRYQNMLDNGIAREVARMCLPVNIYTSFYATANARNLMKFLSLRTKNENATYPSYPQREIEMVAEQMEILWAQKMPITAELFVKYGRVGL